MSSLYEYLSELGLAGAEIERGLSEEGGTGMTPFEVRCAWCLQEQGLPLGDGSHGICAVHAEQLRQLRRARKRGRGR